MYHSKWSPSPRGCVFIFQAEDGIRDLVRSRGLGDVYKRQEEDCARPEGPGNSLGRKGDGEMSEIVVFLPGIMGLSLIHI